MKLYATSKYMPFGDHALAVEFGDVISVDVNRKVHALHAAISDARLHGVGECVPTYRSLLITYDPLKISYEGLASVVKKLENTLRSHGFERKGRRAVIPAVYGGEYGPDLAWVARYHNLSEADVTQVHSANEYLVYMIGFIAGFPYLGELPQQIATPRLETPRIRVPEGSVGIAEKQTGIYPREAPGGWQIIARTPIKLFNSTWHPPTLLEPGDAVKFEPISAEEFERVRSAVSKGDYDIFSED